MAQRNFNKNILWRFVQENKLVIKSLIKNEVTTRVMVWDLGWLPPRAEIAVWSGPVPKKKNN